MTAQPAHKEQFKVASAAEMQAMYEAALLKRRAEFGAAPTTLEALMYSLRSRGTAALREPDCQRRLSELSTQQVRAVAWRLTKLKPHIAKAWAAADIETLLKTKAQL